MKNSTIVYILVVFVLFVSGIFVLNYYQTSKDEKVEEVGVESLTQT